MAQQRGDDRIVPLKQKPHCDGEKIRPHKSLPTGGQAQERIVHKVERIGESRAAGGSARDELMRSPTLDCLEAGKQRSAQEQCKLEVIEACWRNLQSFGREQGEGAAKQRPRRFRQAVECPGNAGSEKPSDRQHAADCVV